jgi:hypothetical protein
MQTPEQAPAPADPHSAEAEHRHHRYVGNYIPWYVHLLWLAFWIFAIAYVISFQLPALQREVLSPP